MGTFKGIPLWILLVIFSPLNAQFGDDGDYNVDETVDYTFDDSIQQHQNILATALPRISIIQAVPTTPVIKAINTAHNNKVCSTWGNFRFKNFDGDIFYFPGTCNYLYSSHCKSTYEDFNIQIRRSVVDNVPVIEKISMKIDGLVVQIDSNSVKVNGETEQLPFSGGGVQIEKNGVYLKVTSKIGLVFMWNEDNSLLLELDEKYSNQTCGLCGDYNSISINNEFISNGVQITETQFGNLQKMDGPTEQCQDVLPTPKTDCTDYANICEGILMGEAFSKCHSLVGVEQYIEACVKDLCLCKSNVTATCLCDTFAEYSRQCAHAGGQPENWRTPDMCPKKCPYNMQYQECGSPCADTCTNPERGVLCADHCLEGCFCPPGTVFDDLSNSGCVPIEQCSCNYNADTYTAGASYATPCSTCICTAGRWNCQNMPCPATCSIEGGSHITTYDQTHYNIFGDCQYVMSKVCNGYEFTVLAELRKCGLTESETCLKSASVLLNGGETIVVIKPCGSVYVNNIYTQLPLSAANITIFKPSSFYIIVETNLRVQVVAQLIPFMQVYVILDPSFKTKTCGLCGNFNDKQTDDFQTINGVIEGTAASFANTWKTQASCSNVKNVYENPCSLSVENEKYAQHWCGLLKDASGPFADCHTTVNPEGYSENCMFDTCNCEKTEDCLCAAISSYVHACAAKGVILTGWRSTLCSKYMNSCPKSQNYTYSVTSCQPTCRSLSEPDVTCNIKFVPVDGCTCTEDYFLDDSGKCVPAAACPCYYRGSAVPSGEVVHDNGIQCTCTQGKLSCIGSPVPACSAPMVYFDCRNSSYGTRGAECQKSCQTLDMECYSTKCTSGCVCPEGLVADGEGKCIAEDLCPCIHNDATYQPGDKIKIKCNTCTCKNRMWQCTNEPCLATCAVYGDGHYITFDGKRYSFDGDCEYTLAQDHCGKNANSSTFRVITENIPCGTTGTTCSKDIKVFLGSYEIILTDEKIDVLQRGIGGEVPYTVRHMGIYLVIEADNGLILMWDKKTSIFIKLSKNFEGSVCGLCGNYDGDGNNDLTTRSMSVVSDIPEFGNSWKLSPTCPDAKVPKDACSINPYRKSWALKQCSIISSEVFSACHPQVDPSKYYDACVTDSCACDTGGDCECFCTAIAAYAQACGESGVCVSWRTPSICPVFCDYYNPEGECEWHYKPCGSPCMKTCRNPSGKCLHELSGLEGCYPSCPAAKPFFDEDDMECVADCGCYDNEGKHYKVGAPVRTTENCQSCSCTLSGISCKYNKEACYCEYHGKMYDYNDVIYNTTDGIGGCITAICKENGTIYRDIYECTTHTTTTSTPFTFTTTPSTTVTGTTTPIPTTLCVKESCQWSEWYDISYPNSNIDGGDFETFTDLRAKGYAICSHPKDVQCRAAHFPDVPLDKLDQRVQCNASFGLLCYNKDQSPPKCYNYEIKVKCCSLVRCDATTTVSTTTEKSTTISSTTPSTIEPTTTKETTTSSTHFTTTSTHKPTTPTTPIKTTTPPTTSTSTAVSSTTIISTTSTCKPICKWTPWIDVHNPIDVKNDGDFETYENIRAAGNHICEKPDGIQCRSEKFPEVPIGRIGQVVQCNVTFGLVCKNEEQEGNIHICLNYQVKVLCCDDGHCLPTTSKLPTTTPSTTKSTTTPTVPTTTSIATTSITTETTTPTPIPTTSITTETTTPIPIPTTSITTETTTPTPKTTTTETTTETTTPTPIPTTSITTETSTPTPIPTTSITTETTTPTPKSTTTETTTETTTPTPIPTTSITTETSTPTPIPTTSISTETTTPTPSPTTTETTTETTTPTPIPTTSSTETTTETTTLTTIPTTTSTTTETTAPTPISTTTSTTTHSTTTETTTPTPIPTTISEHCQPRCKWSTWLDVDSPTKGTDGGDIETYQNFLAKGKQVCKNPQNIECRAEDFPDISIDDVGQVVKCEVTVGLVCNNKDQIGKVKQCFNYQIKVLCCDDYSHCSTTSKATTIPIPTTETTTPTPIPTTTPTTTETNTPIPTTTSTTTETTTPTPIPTTTSTTTTSTIRETTTPIPTTSPTTTETTTPTPVSTTSPSTTSTSTVVSSTTTPVCKPICKWTTWIDVHSPVVGKDEGDFETYENIRAAGKQICKKPDGIECRSEKFPEIPIGQIGQVVQCDVTFGLVCKNEEQEGDFNVCLNYQVKVLCCDDSHCLPTTTELPTTTPSTTKSTTTPTIPTTSSTTSPSTEITPSSATTQCFKEVCDWSIWFDVSYPKSDFDGGDFDTFENIRAKGYSLCKRPEEVECRAERFPDTPLDELEQNVQCNSSFGLLCYNKDQLPPICYNYEIRVKCCKSVRCEIPTTETPTTSVPTTATTIRSTTETTTPTPVPITSSTTTTSTTRESTTPTTTTSTTTETTTPTPIPTTTSTTTTSTTTETTSTPVPTTTVTTTETTTPVPTTTSTTTISTTETTTPTPIPTTTSTTTTSTTTETTTPTPLSTTTPTTTTSTTTETTTPTPVATTTPTTPEACQPRCKWSAWLDVDSPTKGTDGGDIETYQNILAKGKQVCKKPQNIECRAEDFPDISIDDVGQVVQCDVTVGLVCNNKDQTGKVKQCYNYQIKVLCCDDYSHCSTTTIPTTTSIASTETTTSTPVPTTTVTTTETTTPVPTTTSTTTISTTETTTPTPIPTTTSTTTTSTTTETTTPTPLSTTTPTTTTSTTTETTTPTPVATTTPTTPEACQPRCKWSAWLDVDSPTKGTDGGDIETYQNILAKGKQVCKKPQNIECRAEDFPDISIDDVGQVVQCDVTVGLVCNNKDQTGKVKQCYNYQIKVLCCDDYSHCSTTTIPTTTSIASTETTTSTPVPTTTVTTTETTTPVPTTTSTTTISTTETTTPTPIPTTTSTTTTSTTTETTTPTPVPTTTVTTTETTTPVPTATSTTTISTTETTTPTPIPTTTSTTITSTTTETTTPTPVPTTTSTTTTSTTTETTTPTPLSTTTPTTTTSTTTETTTPTPVPTITPTTPEACQPRCKWSAWLDVDSPTKGTDGGDIETYQNILAKGKQVCKKPQNIECRAEDFPDISIDDVGQVVRCDVTVGLVCNNKDQTGKVKQCYNYQIKVLCCDDYSHCSTTTTPTTTSIPTTETTTSTPVPTTTVTTTETTTPTPVPTTTSTTTISTTETTTPTPTPIPTTTSTTTTSTTTETTTPTPVPTTTSTTTTSTTTETTTPTPLSTTTPTTTTSTTTETTTPTPVPTTTPTTPEACQPQCKWSPWLDVDSPTKGTDGGDIETYQNILAKGKQVCKKPQNIECRAEDFPDISIDDVGQVVQCDVTVGLVCNNKDQTGKVKQCYNYQIKVLCCDDYSHCSTTTTPTTTSIPATETTTPTPRFTTSTTTTSTTTETTTPTPIPTTTSTTTETPIPTTSTTTETPIPTTTSTTTETSTPTPLPTTTSASTHSTTTVTTPVPTTSETTLGTPHIVTIWTKTTTPQATGQENNTTECKPNCRWSSWYDVDQPSSGITGGDSETYENIISKGRSICKKPSEIQCRAVNFPGVIFDQIGQNVQCNVNFGLVCKNEEQDGELKMCYNYEIKVLCCDDYSHCETLSTTTIPTTTPTTRTLTTSEPTTTTPYISTTLHCYCHVDNTIFSPGEVIYNKTDEAGCYFYAVCNEKCKADRFQGTCQTTTVPPPVTTTPVPTTSTSETSTTVKSTTPKTHPTTITSTTTTVRSTTSTTITTTPAEGCPPKKTNETWLINNCTVATCHGNNVVTIEPVSCPPVKSLTCANGFPPVKVYSPNGCCFQYECECVCSGWGDPHYITFDGTYYTFLDNCTYVLVQQITPKFDNFRVLVDNYFCDAEDGLSCPQSIMVYYKSNEVVLTRSLYKGKMTNRIRFNENWVTPGFTKNGITVTSAGINMIVEIPEIRAYIKFSGLIFVIKLPFSLFGYNTEGQCGTCSNNSTEDCRLPNGKIISDCSKMANHWKVDMKDRPCYVNPTGPPTVTPTPPTKCESSSICNVILSDVFAECHKMIPPKAYHEGCQFDACYTKNDTISCASIEIYASLCTSIGLCVDWRQKAGGHCPFKCPTGKVYDACGPMHTSTCEHSVLPTVANDLTEGCYCPAGTKLFNSYSDICVATCSCVGPDGMPKNVSEKWISNCQECVCEATSLSVQCKPMTCAKPAPITCDKEGSIIVERPNPDQPCCTINECSCNSSNCLNKIHSCPLGFEVDPVLAEGDCCPTYDCRPTVTCVVHDTIYQPGHKIPPTKDSCEDCFCTHEKDPETLLNLVKCDPIPCTKVCEKGYTYKEKAGQCCGDCVQVACVMQMDVDQTTVVIQPGETWYSQVDKCSYFECNKSNEHFVIMSVSKECTVASESDCAQGYVYKKVGDQCCGTCVQEACIMKLKDNSIKVLKPGDVWNPPNEVCNYYECHIIKDVPNDQYVPVEVRRKCDVVKCETGYEYKIKSGECCGGCIKVACTMTMNDNITITLQPGEEYIPQDEKCISYTCSNTYEVLTTKEICPYFNPTECLEGTITLSKNGCCKTCETVGCQVRKQSTVLKTGTCQSDQAVELTYCEGRCKTTSKYSSDANSMQHSCSCCQEKKTSKREVSLKCLDGRSSSYSYIYVEECGCTTTECEKDSQTSTQQEQQVETDQDQQQLVT